MTLERDSPFHDKEKPRDTKVDEGRVVGFQALFHQELDRFENLKHGQDKGNLKDAVGHHLSRLVSGVPQGI